MPGIRKRLTYANIVSTVCLILLTVFLALLAPSGAGAATINFFSTDGLGPTGGAGTEGPANVYPSSIDVEGLSGTLTKVTMTAIRFASGSPDDVDMLLVGPEGDQVMLMSDACGEAGGFTNSTWTFDDDAPTSLPDSGPCPTGTAASFKPSNYVGNSPEPDEFGVGGGVFPPFADTLSTFGGTNPNGFWDLYVRDDHEGVVGFEILGWALTLTVEPPAEPTPAVPTPAPSTPTQSTPPPTGTPPAPTDQKKKTGRRARALARCKKKQTKAKRVACRVKARRLPA
jgi:hypothetical protein